MKWSCRAAEASSHCERLLVKVQSQWQLKAKGWRVHTKKLKLGTWREPMRGYWWRQSPVAAEDLRVLGSFGYWGKVRTMGKPPRTAAAAEWRQPESSTQSSVCRAGELPQSLWKSPEDHKRIQDNWTLGYLYCWSWAHNTLLVFPSWRRYLI